MFAAAIRAGGSIITLVSVLDLDNMSFSKAIHAKDRGNSPEHAGCASTAAIEIST
jgi:hypothetical protein